MAAGQIRERDRAEVALSAAGKRLLLRVRSHVEAQERAMDANGVRRLVLPMARFAVG